MRLQLPEGSRWERSRGQLQRWPHVRRLLVESEGDVGGDEWEVWESVPGSRVETLELAVFDPWPHVLDAINGGRDVIAAVEHAFAVHMEKVNASAGAERTNRLRAARRRYEAKRPRRHRVDNRKRNRADYMRAYRARKTVDRRAA